MKTETFTHNGSRYQIIMPFDNLWIMPGQLGQAIDKDRLLLEQGELIQVAFYPHPTSGSAIAKLGIRQIPPETRRQRIDRIVGRVLEFVGFAFILLTIMAFLVFFVIEAGRAGH